MDGGRDSMTFYPLSEGVTKPGKENERNMLVILCHEPEIVSSINGKACCRWIIFNVENYKEIIKT